MLTEDVRSNSAINIPITQQKLPPAKSANCTNGVNSIIEHDLYSPN